MTSATRWSCFHVQATLKSKALANLTSNLEFEKQEKQSRGSANMDAAAAINQCLSGSGRKQEPDTTGYVWVGALHDNSRDMPALRKDQHEACCTARHDMMQL